MILSRFVMLNTINTRLNGQLLSNLKDNELACGFFYSESSMLVIHFVMSFINSWIQLIQLISNKNAGCPMS